MAINPVDMAILEAMVGDMLEDHKQIVLARRYHVGDQDVYLDDRMTEFLGLHDENPFVLNICKTIVTALSDELSVVGFDTSEKKDKDGQKPQAIWARDVMDKNRFDALQGNVHEAVLRDRETFVIVDWDDENKRPRFTHNLRYTDVDANGDGAGCWMLYENDDPEQSPRAAVKQWTQINYDENGQPYFVTRRNVYYADRVEKWYYESGWKPYNVEGAPWNVAWVGKDGKPMGIPVIHFKNKGLMPEAWDAIPMNDAINKTLVDILATSDMSAFQVFVALGFYPTTDGQAPKSDGSNLLNIKPGSWVGSTKGKNEADVKVVTGQDVTPMMSTLKDLIVLAAQITATPVSRFVASGQVAGSETLKEQEQPLKKKAADRRILFGNAWEDCMAMARKLENRYGTANLDEDVSFSTLWGHSETLDDLQNKKNLGVPQETIWMEMGYTAEQIEGMKATEEYRLSSAKMLWEAAKFATEAGVPLETFLIQSAGWDKARLSELGTQRLAAIALQQEDTIPPTRQ